MSKAQKALIGHLEAAIAPYLSPAAGPTPKVVAKTLRKLAKQLLEKQGKTKTDKPKATSSAPTPKQARKALTNELANALQPHLGFEEEMMDEFPKGITKELKRLSGEVVRQRRKRARQAAKALKTATTISGTPPAEVLPIPTPAPAPLARPVLQVPPRRSAAPKRPTKAAPAADGAAAPATAADQD